MWPTASARLLLHGDRAESLLLRTPTQPHVLVSWSHGFMVSQLRTTKTRRIVSYPSLDADHTLYQCDSFAAIVKMTQHTYYSDWVSWKGDSGRYYVQVIDRSLRRKFEEEMSGRSRRR
jgi:hypothetical protein